VVALQLRLGSRLGSTRCWSRIVSRGGLRVTNRRLLGAKPNSPEVKYRPSKARRKITYRAETFAFFLGGAFGLSVEGRFRESDMLRGGGGGGTLVERRRPCSSKGMRR